MKRETRTRIIDTEGAIDAAFALCLDIMEDPETFPEELNGATFRPVDRVDYGPNEPREWSFEVAPAAGGTGRAIVHPELSRSLVTA
jgi:hypothetical protein